MIKILLIILALIVLAAAGVFLYAYVQAKREAEKEAAQRANLEAWLEYYKVDSTGETWHTVTTHSGSAGQDVPVFTGEYNRPIPQGGSGRQPGGYTVPKRKIL